MMRIPSHSETRRLLAAIDPRDPFAERDQVMLILAMNTGLRVSELVGLDIGHVAHQGVPRQALHLPRSITKGERERTIPLNEPARQAIQVLLAFNRKRGFSVAPDAPVFVTRKHQRVSVRLVQRLVQHLREVAGLDVPLTPHTLRHGFATDIMHATGNLRVVQQLLGHRRLATVEIYAHVSRELCAQAVEQIAYLTAGLQAAVSLIARRPMPPCA